MLCIYCERIKSVESESNGKGRGCQQKTRENARYRENTREITRYCEIFGAAARYPAMGGNYHFRQNLRGY